MRTPARLKSAIGVVAAAVVASALPVVATSPASAVTDPMTVSMTATPNPVAVGSTLTYTVVATTTAPQQTNVGLNDQLTGLTNVVLTSSRGFCTLSNLLVSCSAGSIPNQGETWTVTVTGQVTAGTGTALPNTATVTGNWSPQNTSQTFSVAASTNVQVLNQPSSPLPNLQVAVTGPATASPGANVTYTLTVFNSGGANATDIQVNASLPPGFNLQPGSAVQGTSLFGCSASLPGIICTGGAINAGANATITIPAAVSNDPGPISWTVTAVVDPENAIPESTETDNTGQWTLNVPAGSPPPGQITFTKTASSPVDPGAGTQVRPNDILTYTITTHNTGTGSTSATRLQITDGTQGLDQSAVSVKSSDSKLVCKNSNALVTCAANNNNYTLNAGATVTVTVSGRVVQPPSSIISNTATLQTLQNKVAITRTASVSTIVRPGVDLTVTQYATCTPSQPSPGAPSLLACPPFRARNQFDYLITVGNSGLNDAGPMSAGSTAPPVTVREPLPPDVIFESFDNLTPSGGFSCAVDTNNVVNCLGGAVPGALSSGMYPGTTRGIRLHLTAPDSIGPITGTVTVDPYNTIAESDETNNTATTTTPIATGIDLTISQSVRCPRDTRMAPLMCDPVAPSGTLIYDILVTNVGTQDATGIKVSDVLPVGTRFRSAKEVPPVYGPGVPYTPAHGLSCTSTNGSEVDCTGGRLLGIYAAYGGPKLHTSGIPDNFTIEVTAFAPAPYGPQSSPSATGSPILNQVQVDPDNTIPEINENNDLNVLETNVGIPPLGDWGTFNELTVTDQQTSPPSGVAVAPNGTLQYTLTVSNWGSDPVSNVTVNDYVPTGSRFRDVTVAPLTNGTGGFSCSFNNQNAAVLTCTNGALAASPGVGFATSTTITILLFAPPTPNATTNQYTNHAVVDPNNAIPEADETNNASDVSLTVALPVLVSGGGGQNIYNELTVLNQQSNPVSGPVAPYGTLQYTLTAQNWGSDPASGATVYDYLPQGAQFRDVTVQPLSGGSGGFLCNYNSGLVSCNNGSLAAAPVPGVIPSTATITILLFAPGTPNPVGSTNQYTNHAVINPNGTVPEADVTNDATDTALVVSYPPPTDGTGANAYNEFTISSSQVFPASNGPVAPGGTLLYKLTVPNTGTDTAVNVPVRDYLPTGTTFRLAQLDALSTSGVTGFICTQNSGVVDCVNGTIPSGGQAVIDILLFAPNQPTSPGSQSPYNIINQAVVNPNGTVQEADPTNDTSTTTTTVSLGGGEGYWDLTTNLSGSDTTGQPDQPIHYTLTVQNLGTDDLYNATVSDTLPAGTTFVSATDHSPGAGQFTCIVNGQVITCTGGTILGTANGGATRQIDIVANAPHANGSIVDQAAADPTNTVPEADETNNSSNISTDVESVIDLSISLDSASIGQGNEGDITGQIANNGTADAQNVQSIWNLPIGVTVLDVNPPAGTVCTSTQNPVNQFVCTTPTLGQGQSLQFTFHVYDNSSNTLNDSAVINADNKTVESDASNDTNDVANSTVS